MQIPEALTKIVAGENLSQSDTAAVFQQIMSGDATPGQIGAVLAALRVKGETAEEIAGAALTMRELSTKVAVNSDHWLTPAEPAAVAASCSIFQPPPPLSRPLLEPKSLNTAIAK